LNVFPIHVSPLRDRPEDIGVLTAHLAAKYAAQFGRRVSRIDRRTLTWLEAYTWPGNVRELENLVARAVIIADDEVLRIPKLLLSPARSAEPLDATMDGREREAIEAALQACRGRVAGNDGAARRLGLARRWNRAFSGLASTSTAFARGPGPEPRLERELDALV
jgi:formate hydrogenlyase transcriptional activator